MQVIRQAAQISSESKFWTFSSETIPLLSPALSPMVAPAMGTSSSFTIGPPASLVGSQSLPIDLSKPNGTSRISTASAGRMRFLFYTHPQTHTHTHTHAQTHTNTDTQVKSRQVDQFSRTRRVFNLACRTRSTGFLTWRAERGPLARARRSHAAELCGDDFLARTQTHTHTHTYTHTHIHIHILVSLVSAVDYRGSHSEAARARRYPCSEAVRRRLSGAYKTHTHKHTHTRTHTHKHGHVQTHTHTHIQAQIHTHVHTHKHGHIQSHTDTRTQTGTYTHTHTHTHTHPHTHTHTHIQTDTRTQAHTHMKSFGEKSRRHPTLYQFFSGKIGYQ